MKVNGYKSLLWLSEDRDTFELDDKSVEDIDMSHVFHQHNELMTPWLTSVIRKLPKDKELILYRQEILRDFNKNSRLLDEFMRVAGIFYETRNLIKFAFERDHTLYNVLKRMEDSEVILKGISDLRRVLNEVSVQSLGLERFHQMLNELVQSELFLSYESDLKSIRKKESIQSIKLGLNLDGDMNPKEAIVLTLEEEPFKYTRSMKKVTKIIGYGFNEIKKIPRRIFAPETLIPKENLNELEKIISPAMGQLLRFIDTFNGAILDVFEPLKEELSYYNLGVHMKNGLTAMGHPVSQVVYHEGVAHDIQKLYNANLAYYLQPTGQAMIYNNMKWFDHNMYLLTGANRGGKTTFTQAIGQVNWLGALGFYVPASSANLPVIDGLFVHFPIEETETVLYGRLGEECERFAKLFGQMTSESLLLMNESFSGTSHSESLTIARDALHATAKIGVTGLFNTHLHELAGDVDGLNLLGQEDGYAFKNLVSGSKDDHQSFIIQEGIPLGKSYAHDIAVKYGISFEQLME